MDNQFQKTINVNATDLCRLNQFALRETEDGTYQFITVPPRTVEQEYIDHSLLNPDYLGGDNIQIDLLQATNGNAYQQQPTDRQFLNESELVGELQIHHELNEANDQRVKQALLQYINKNYQTPAQIITTDNVVKLKITEPEMPPLTPIRNHYNYPRVMNQQSQAIQTNQIQLLKDKLEEDGRNLKSDYDDSESLQSRLVIKKNLPHKKRISTKLKSINKKSIDNKNSLNNGCRSNDNSTATRYTCELCGYQISEQLNFFSHLKLHYEPTCITMEQQSATEDLNTIVHTDDVSLPVLKIENLNNEITTHDSNTIDNEIEHEFESSVEYPTSNLLNSNDKTSLIDHTNDEFSDTEDMLEGIRSVVDKVQQSVDNDLIAISDNTKDWFNNHTNIHSTFDNDTRDVDARKHSSGIYGNLRTTIEIDGKVIYDDTSLTETSILRSQLAKSTKGENEVKPILTLREMRENYVEEREEDDMESKKSKGRKKIYVCKVCEKVCNSRNALHYHFLSHSGERPHVCEQCGKRFYSISALKVHRRVHTLEKPFSCDHCGRAFRQWGDLSYHITSIHTEEKSHTCEFCGKNFARRYSLVIHRRIHTNERNYKCDYCNKAFRASSYLQDHRKIHTGEKNHKCPTCGKLFRVRGDLKRHLKIHLRLIEKERTKKLKDNNDMFENMPSNNDNLKSNVSYSDANGDIFHESCISEVVSSAINNNIENINCPSTRKKKLKNPSNTKQKKNKADGKMYGNSSPIVLQPSSSIEHLQNAESLVASIPVDISKIILKQEKVDSIITAASDDQYQIYLLES